MLKPAPTAEIPEDLQAAIYRQMSPAQRLQQAMNMNRSLRALMESGLRATHPHFTALERSEEIARRIRHVRT